VAHLHACLSCLTGHSKQRLYLCPSIIHLNSVVPWWQAALYRAGARIRLSRWRAVANAVPSTSLNVPAAVGRQPYAHANTCRRWVLPTCLAICIYTKYANRCLPLATARRSRHLHLSVPLAALLVEPRVAASGQNLPACAAFAQRPYLSDTVSYGNIYSAFHATALQRMRLPGMAKTRSKEPNSKALCLLVV